MINQQIGPYRINNLLGEGGMAHVLIAEKGNLGKKVALKVLKKEFLYNDHIRGRFLAEAKNMIQINHPNIVSVQDLIDEPDFVAIELEYIEGETLKQYLERKGALPDPEIERLIEQMWSAVSYIHHKGFVHRDIKPSNFMIANNGIIKLTDFGIAKNLDNANPDYTGTGTGMVLGTPKYMSPEQVRNTKDVNAQSDIYSLGVVLWEMVTGKVPYDINTESTFDVFEKIVRQPLSKTNTIWDVVIDVATHKEVGDRGFVVQNKIPDFEPAENKTNASTSLFNKKNKILIIFGVIIGISLLTRLLYKNNYSDQSSISPEVLKDETKLNSFFVRIFDEVVQLTIEEELKKTELIHVDSTTMFRSSIEPFWNIHNHEIVKTIFGLSPLIVADFSRNGVENAILNYKNDLKNDRERNQVLKTLKSKNEFSWLDDISISVFFKTRDFETIEYSFEGHRGGVSWTDRKYLTINLAKNKVVHFDDIFANMNNQQYNQIIEAYTNSFQCIYDDSLIPFPETLYFDKNNVTFVYEKYKIACGADGVVKITVPFDDFRNHLSDEFKNQFLVR